MMREVSHGGNAGGGQPKSGASHPLGNRGAIPTFPPRDYCCIYLKTFTERSRLSPCTFSPQAHSSIGKHCLQTDIRRVAQQRGSPEARISLFSIAHGTLA